MNRNIRIEIIVIIILLFTIIFGGKTFLKNSREFPKEEGIKNENVEKAQIKSPKNNNDKKDSKRDQNNKEYCTTSLPEFGDVVNSNEKSILYNTTCIIEDSNMSYDGLRVSRVYLRGAGNEYNKKIFETTEKISYDSIIGKNKDIVRIQTSDEYGENKMVYFFDKRGEKIDYKSEEESDYKNEYVSPNGRYLASLPNMTKSGYRPAAVVKIVDTKSGKVNEYDFRKDVHELNGIIIDSWSPDSDYLYVVGGIYEFGAPAKLWKIDVKNNKVKDFNLDGLSFPVEIYPEYQIAFVSNRRDGDNMYAGDFVSSGSVEEVSEENKKLIDLELFKINLDDGEVSSFVKEKALSSFRNLFFNGSHVYFESTYGLAEINSDSFRNSSVIKKVNFDTGKNRLYSDDESHIWLFVPEKNALILEEDKKMYYVNLEDDKRDLIGDVTINVAGANKLNNEYIRNVEGLVN